MKKQDANSQVTLRTRLKGKKSAQDGVVEAAPRRLLVQLDREGTDKIFAVPSSS